MIVSTHGYEDGYSSLTHGYKLPRASWTRRQPATCITCHVAASLTSGGGYHPSGTRPGSVSTHAK